MHDMVHMILKSISSNRIAGENMGKKENILEALIMVEQLSEGEINPRGTELSTITYPENGDYYSAFRSFMSRKNRNGYNSSGIMIYFDCFSFNSVLDIIIKTYDVPAVEEAYESQRFRFIVCFDQNLKLEENLTFFSASGYIRDFKKIPEDRSFQEYEMNQKGMIADFFNQDDADYRNTFNQGFEKLLNYFEIGWDNNILHNTKISFCNNLFSEATNLHSFFIEDLCKAKKMNSENLNDYLMGEAKQRVNLDSMQSSENFNPSVFEQILQPENYPTGRFPSSPDSSLSFMQQVAVNLVIGADGETMRSVNGPPGTGKTTMLRDIFAELVVQQAHDIASTNGLEGQYGDRYRYNGFVINELPECLAGKGIVVASSNNSVVQNIVNEMPLIDRIDPVFADELKEADYFKDIANRIMPARKSGTDKHYWGLFSLEGGKRENINRIIDALGEVYDYLDQEYSSDKGVYQRFEDAYQDVISYKKKIRSYIDSKNNIDALKQKLHECKQFYENTLQIYNTVTPVTDRKLQETNEVLDQQQKELAVIQDRLKAVQLEMNTHISHKPLFMFIRKKVRTEFKQKEAELSQQVDSISVEEKQVLGQIAEYDSIRENLEKEKSESDMNLNQAKSRYEEAYRNCNMAETILSDGKNIRELDMSLPYESLQFENPWFDKEFRVKQSRLFILALKVRKQFLYERRQNIKYARNIWMSKTRIRNEKVAGETWNWINMVIPVISSTFASFGRMFRDVNENSIGYLFIDEAGQALPQAGVGAIFRSRQIIVVGDPAQITPVLTLNESVLQMLREYYDVKSEYLSENASVQTIAERVGKYGYAKNANEWIGIPLWVHRRCSSPMFDISNAISYNGNMVQGQIQPGHAEWIDVSGKANNKYVPQQGMVLMQLIEEMAKKNPNIKDRTKPDSVYVISPFRNVAKQLAELLKKTGFTRMENGYPTNIGTVHTFQGKEADTVFLVLGCDESSISAAMWAMGSNNPNIMNVAATRAKQNLYIIGDKKLYQSLNSRVVNETIRIIDNTDGSTSITL